jgi:hypothetical protein
MSQGSHYLSWDVFRAKRAWIGYLALQLCTKLNLCTTLNLHTEDMEGKFGHGDQKVTTIVFSRIQGGLNSFI